MKKIILLTLISFILNIDITLSPSAIALDEGKIKIYEIDKNYVNIEKNANSKFNYICCQK